MRTTLIILVVTFLLGFTERLLANAWMLPAGEQSGEIYGKFYWATKDYNYRGNKVAKPNNGRYEEFRPELKVELGLYDQLNLLLSVPYKWARWEDRNGTLENDDLEFVGVGAKVKLFGGDDDMVASLQMKFEMPGGYDRNDPPSLGHEKSDLETRLMVGKVFDNGTELVTLLRLYHVGGEIGYRTLNNKIPYFLEVGFQPIEKILIKGMVDGVIATSDINRPPTNRELIKKKYEEYAKVMGEVLISSKGAFNILKNIDKDLTIGFGYGYTFHGKNTAVGSEITLKIFYRF